MNHTIFFLGMAMLQVIFITYQYILFKRKEFLYYLLYTFCMTIFVCFKAFPEYDPIHVFFTRPERFTAGRSILLMGYALYYRFGRYFTETPRLYPRLNRQLLVVEWIFLAFATSDLILLINGVSFNVLEPVSRMIYLLAMPFSFYAIIYLLTRKRKLTSIYVIGSGLLLAFASASFVDMFFISHHSRTESAYLLYIELGIFSEFVFLNYGLIYKTRLIQKENMRLEVEKQVELYKQRMRISNDLHDEVGATLSGIALFSQITRDQFRHHDTEKVERSLSLMEQSAAEMVDKLSEIVWTVNPDQDSMDKLVQKLEEYAQETGSAKNIRVHSSICEDLKALILPMEDRRNIYLLCKEAINNAIKYSQCSELLLKAEFRENTLHFMVEDNGKGFDPAQIKKGNGLDNMMRRAKDLSACLEIDTCPGRGTKIILHKKIPQ
ncbi:MAG: histidine kinase [Flavisolibacter sp.]